MSAFESLVADLDGIPIETKPERVRRRSRVQSPFSPILRRRLEGLGADLWAAPRDEEETVAVLSAAARHGVPVTLRGGGTSLGGQATPLSGGIVLDLGAMGQIQEIRQGRVRAQAGARFAEIDDAARSHSRQELRLYPTTCETATIGGFVGSGIGGVGSVTWGLMDAPGNILSARVLTLERDPRRLELTGAELDRIAGAWGTTGVIAELELPLTAAYRWAEMVVAFDDRNAALAFAETLARESGLLKKLVTCLAAPLAAYALPERLAGERDHAVLVQAADISLVATRELVARSGGRILLDRFQDVRGGAPPLFTCAWHHVTERALKADPGLCHLQALVPPPFGGRVAALAETLGDEALLHLELVRLQGSVGAVALPLLRTGEAGLADAARRIEAAGCRLLDPHRLDLGGGDPRQEGRVRFAAGADPFGLLNPGKLKGSPFLTARAQPLSSAGL
ncbi:MAG: FAD-binding oxidoreductase [Geminicoccaceae bacterium]|nr:FAD-binding oxidoreductase [Geminicoccaceae bacterium]